MNWKAICFTNICGFQEEHSYYFTFSPSILFNWTNCLLIVCVIHSERHRLQPGPLTHADLCKFCTGLCHLLQTSQCNYQWKGGLLARDTVPVGADPGSRTPISANGHFWETKAYMQCANAAALGMLAACSVTPSLHTVQILSRFCCFHSVSSFLHSCYFLHENCGMRK